MGKSLLLAVAAISLATGVITMRSTRTTMVSTGETLASQSEAAGARSIAHSGLAVAESALAAELAATASYTGPTEFTGPYTGGTYRATITVSGTEYTVLSEGVAGEDTSRVQRAYRFEASSPPLGPVPAFMAPAFTIGNSLQISDNFTVRSEDPTVNATIHANNSIKFNAGTSYIEGFATVGNGVSYNAGNTESSVFHPVSNPDGLPLTKKVSEITVPVFDADAHRGIATRTTLGDLTLSGTVTLGTRDAPVIWYVGGDVRTTGPVTIEGYGVFMVHNSIRVNHAIQGTAGAAGESTVGFYTGNSIHISGGGAFDIAGQFLIGNSIHSDGPVSFRGSMTVGNSIKTNSPFTTVYRPASNVLTDPFWPPDPTVAPPPSTPGSGARLITVSTRVW